MNTATINSYVDSKIHFIKNFTGDSLRIPVINKEAAARIAKRLPGYVIKQFGPTISIKKPPQ